MSLVLLIGDRESGKTTTCRRLAEHARACNFTVAGIVTPAVHESWERPGYEIVDLATGRSTSLTTMHDPGMRRVGRFYFSAEGLALGNRALEHAVRSGSDLVIVDEVGPLELSGGGWAAHLEELAHRPKLSVFTIRRRIVPRFVKMLATPPAATVDLADGVDLALERLITLLEGARRADQPNNRT